MTTTTTLRRSLIATLLGAATLALPAFSHAAELDPADLRGLFAPPQIDKNHDNMVSKKEFMDMMSKAWDMEAGKMKMKGDKMTLDEYKAFARMFNLNIGG